MPESWPKKMHCWCDEGILTWRSDYNDDRYQCSKSECGAALVKISGTSMVRKVAGLPNQIIQIGSKEAWKRAAGKEDVQI